MYATILFLCSRPLRENEQGCHDIFVCLSRAEYIWQIECLADGICFNGSVCVNIDSAHAVTVQDRKLLLLWHLLLMLLLPVHAVPAQLQPNKLLCRLTCWQRLYS